MLTRLGTPLTLGILLFGAQATHAGELPVPTCVPRPDGTGTGPLQESPLLRRLATKMDAVGREVGVAPALHQAVVMQESSGRPHVVSETGAVGLTQLMPVAIRQYAPEAAQVLGRPVRATRMHDNLVLGALYYRDALRQTHGNVEAAARLYHGGPNTALHGPRTLAYGKAVAVCYRQITASARRAANARSAPGWERARRADFAAIGEREVPAPAVYRARHAS